MLPECKANCNRKPGFHYKRSLCVAKKHLTRKESVSNSTGSRTKWSHSREEIWIREKTKPWQWCVRTAQRWWNLRTFIIFLMSALLPQCLGSWPCMLIAHTWRAGEPCPQPSLSSLKKIQTSNPSGNHGTQQPPARLCISQCLYCT